MISFSTQLQELVVDSAIRAGFELAGITAICLEDSAELAFFTEWIEKGYCGEMSYLEARSGNGALKRSSLRNALPWANSVVVCALNYNTDNPYSSDVTSARQGWISRYAWSADQRTGKPVPTDYHREVLRRLQWVEKELRERVEESSLQTRCYVDTGPLVERAYAKCAGLGWIGKNTCLINQKLGSWLFLGVIITSLEIPNDAKLAIQAPDRCGSCTRCLDACPTSAFVAPRKMDANRCISYLTIEKRGKIAEELCAKIGRQIFGCDICQDVCPWNSRAPVTCKPELQAHPDLINPDLGRLAQMSEEEFRQAFNGSPLKRAKYSGFRRNIAIAMGNSGDPSLLPEVERLCRSKDAVVAEHAEWALHNLDPNTATSGRSGAT